SVKNNENILRMRTLKLIFDIAIDGEPRTYVVEVLYRKGFIAISEFRPPELLAQTIDMASVMHKVTLDEVVKNCHIQLLAMSKITKADTELDRHIGGLMAAVMEHLSCDRELAFGDFLTYMDCFCLLLKAANFDAEEIRIMYPIIAKTIPELYPGRITCVPEALTCGDKRLGLSVP
ncbi:MAG: hypothetical protein ACI30K_08195, partial [Muribaculaceae bacterium]